MKMLNKWRKLKMNEIDEIRSNAHIGNLFYAVAISGVKDEDAVRASEEFRETKKLQSRNYDQPKLNNTQN